MTAREGNLHLPDNDWGELKRILQRYLPDCEVWAFGSRAKGTAKPYSDLDLAVITEEPLPLGTMADLRNAFDDSDMTIKVDIVDWATTSPAFRNIIQESHVVVQEKEC